MFKELDSIGYDSYLKKFPFHHDLNLKIDNWTDKQLRLKTAKTVKSSVDPTNLVPIAPEIDDLIRLHYLVTTRKVATILEFGVGKSTVVFNNALDFNKDKYYGWIKNNLRKSNLFEVHSVDNSRKWIKHMNKSHKLQNAFIHFSKSRMGVFNDRICTYYDLIPNVSPDLIYLDAPDQFSTKGNIAGISTRNPDRLPMAADILRIEHFLLPGTLIVVDGRAANARFLKCNLQRNWSYKYIDAYDQHFFELIEKPLGKYNKMQIAFSKSKRLVFK